MANKYFFSIKYLGEIWRYDGSVAVTSISYNHSAKPFNIQDKYKYPGKFLGAGSFAKVNQGTEILTDKLVAIKRIEKSKSDVRYIESEIKILKTCQGHSNILNLLDVYETDQYLYIVADVATGGHLLDKVSKVGKVFLTATICQI